MNAIVSHRYSGKTVTVRNHIEELDGVRGVAILMVLLMHFTPPEVVLPIRALEWLRKAASAGWIGVDLFFVLSGFLITGILLRTKGKPGALKIFFARRILRIFPLYFAVLFAVFIVPMLAIRLGGFQPRPEFQTLLHLQGWVWLHSTNIGMYLEPARAFQLVSHFWSLSVEEHFYVIWPFLVFLVSRRRLRTICLGIVFFALVLRLAGVATHQNPYFFVLTPCRIDALAIGGYLAAFAAGRPLLDLRRKALLAAGVSAASLAVFFVAAHGLWAWSPWIQGPGLTLIGLLFGSLLVIVLSGHTDSFPRRCCRNSALRFFGYYSYGIYVIHNLLAEPLNRLLPFGVVAGWMGSVYFALAAIIVAKIAVSLAAALVSWHVIEQPALRWKRYFIVPDVDRDRDGGDAQPDREHSPVRDFARIAGKPAA